MEKSLSRAGAVGNGKAIDTDAIQEAIAEVERNTLFETYTSNTPFLGAGELVWPQGLFLVDDSIRITRSILLRGEGHAEYSSGARIQQQQPGKDLFRVEPIAQGCSISINNLVLRANGGGNSGGALLRILKAAGQCNSVRVADVVFATPQNYAIDIQRGDDLMIGRCLFDASATQCIRLGGALSEDKVTNAKLFDNYFFSIAEVCIALNNANGVIIQGNNVYSEGGTRTFLQSTKTDYSHVSNVLVYGNTFKRVECISDLAAAKNIIIQTNVGEMMGKEQSSLGMIRFTGLCTNIMLTNNILNGNTGEIGIYNDQAATVDNAVITGNVFTAVGLKDRAGFAVNTAGEISGNIFADN